LTWLALAAMAGMASAQDVTLTDNGSTVTLANGIVSAVITKNNGKCTDLPQAGGVMMAGAGGFPGATYQVQAAARGRLQIYLNRARAC